ncbi:MAG: (d)CMP kinase [Clostridia bacterium]|nr:(d)CMP kinase [Clostridia bacterium]
MINIALDGPAGSGKSTIAKAISKKLNILYLDTGAMYRALGLSAYRLGVDTKDAVAVEKILPNVDVRVKYENGSQRTYLGEEDVSEKIRENHVSMLASNVSAHQCVREKLVELQREIAKGTDCVLDGRDIGTHVLPNANYKFYVTASLEERTERRYKELIAKGQTVDKNALKEEIATRDYNDSHRKFAPLRQAEDAIYLDTSDMTADEVVAFVVSKIK